MTRSVSAHAVRLSLALAVLIGAALWVGLQQPPSDWEKLFRLNDCQLPCWIGIEPGKTTLEEAQRQVETAYQNSSDYLLEEFASTQYAVTNRQTHDRIGITLAAGDERQTNPPTVHQIHLWADVVPNRRVTIAELYSSLGNAEALRLSTIGAEPFLIMLYQAKTVGLATNVPQCTAVLPRQKIYQIVISARSLDSYFGTVSTPASWLGFRRCHNLHLAINS